MKPGTYIKLYELLSGNNDSVKLACIMQDMFTVAAWNRAIKSIYTDCLNNIHDRSTYWNVSHIFVFEKLFYGYIDVCYKQKFTRRDIINFTERIIKFIEYV